MSINVIYNARCLEYKMSGIERYTKELILGLLSNELIDSATLLTQNEIVFGQQDSSIIHKKRKSFERLPASISRLYWESIDLSYMLKNVDGDIFHSPNFMLPTVVDKKKKNVITIHDFAFLHFPECFDIKTKLYYKLMLNKSLNNADKIICISESTFHDLKLFYPQYVNKAVVVYNGFTDFSEVKSDQSILNSLNLEPNSFYLTVGTINKRKNLRRIIDAFTKLSDTGVTNKKLVLVGDQKNLSSFTNLPDNILFTGFISDESLSCLYKSCYSFIFPSLYEGFGFPVLEAMSCGKPVVTSNVSSLPEISGYDDKYLVDPFSTDSIFNLMKEMENSEFLHGEMSAMSSVNISRFGWSKMARDTADVYFGLCD